MTTIRREHLHCPLTLVVLEALFAHRLERAAEISYEPTERGAFVDWERLLNGWLSSTEEAAVRIAWGASVAGRRGGLPEELRAPARALLEELTR